jgi:hypothetical protein
MEDLMQINAKQALENTQTIFFDVCDLLEGNSYNSLGYDNRKEFLSTAKEKLSEIERFIDQNFFNEDQKLSKTEEWIKQVNRDIREGNV